MDGTRLPDISRKTSDIEHLAIRSGTRRSIFGVRPNKAYYDEKRQIGNKTPSQFQFTAGERYVGNWLHNKKDGFGIQVWAQGHKYEGDWVANLKHGRGTFWVMEEGKLRKQYTGDWVDDQRHGHGVFTYRNGDRYEGEWKKHSKHGMGKMFYGKQSPEGSYNGSWSDDERSGLGILFMANGDWYEGHWLHDKKQGPGRYFYLSTGKVYEGEWVDDVPKCGQLQDAPPECFPSTPTGRSFKLPNLRLLGSDTVFSEGVAKLRHQIIEQVFPLN